MRPAALFVLLMILPAAALAQAPGTIDDTFVLNWTAQKDVSDVKAIFPHPTDPTAAWLATAEGLLVTADEGKTWKPVPAAAAEKIGLVTTLACCPADEKRLLLGTDAKGLYLSADGGATLKKLGADADKPAAEHIECADFWRWDPSWRTLLVTHGQAAPGISISHDLGRTWFTFATDRYLKQFAHDGDTLVAAGSMAETQGRTWGIHRSGFVGQRWEECNRGIQAGEATVANLRPNHFFVCTGEGNILQGDNDGQTWSPVYQGEAAWASLQIVFGRVDQAELMLAYDPHKQGVVLSGNRFRQRRACNTGLYVGPFVKSGASARANCNGTVFYAVANAALSVGRRVEPKTGPFIAQARVLPATTWVGPRATRTAERNIHEQIGRIAGGDASAGGVAAIAAESKKLVEVKDTNRVTIQAKVTHPQGPAGIKAVTVDLSLLGGSRTSALFDDGKHDDGQAGDGLYGLEAPFDPASFERQGNDRRWPLPRMSSMTVTAIDTAGAATTVTAVISIQRRPETLSIWPGLRPLRFGNTDSDGPVQAHETQDAFGVSITGTQPWRARWLCGESGANGAGLGELTFSVHGDSQPELIVQLMDNYVVGEDHIDEPHASKPIRLIADGYIKALTAQPQKVRIPIEKLLPKDLLFLRRHVAGLALSAPEGKVGKVYVESFQLEPGKE